MPPMQMGGIEFHTTSNLKCSDRETTIGLRLDLDMGLVLSLLRDDEEADKVNPYMGRPIKSAQQNDSCFYSAR